MKSRAQLDAIAAEDMLFKERLTIADDLIEATKALDQLRKTLATCSTDEERANVRRVIENGADDVRKLGERLLFIATAPTATGNA